MAIENWTWFYDANPAIHEDEDEDFNLEQIRAEMEDPAAWEPVT